MTLVDSTHCGLVNQGGFFSLYYLFEFLAWQHDLETVNRLRFSG
jgi:hypothetical protein